MKGADNSAGVKQSDPILNASTMVNTHKTIAFDFDSENYINENGSACLIPENGTVEGGRDANLCHGLAKTLFR